MSAAVSDPILIRVADPRDLTVEYIGLDEGASASVDVTYSGGQLLSVPLTGVQPAPVPILGW